MLIQYQHLIEFYPSVLRVDCLLKMGNIKINNKEFKSLIINSNMNKHTTANYDSKSSIFSAQYKIPYDCSESSRIVEHLEESQQQLEFLKYKLTEAYEKLQQEIKNSIQLQNQNDGLQIKMQDMKQKLKIGEMENTKLKQVMETVLKNRKLLEEQVEYTHKRYKKMLEQKQQEHEVSKHKLERQVQKLQNQIEFMEEQLQSSIARQNLEKFRDKEREYEQKIKTLENEIVRLTNQKVTQVSRLRHEIDCYQRSYSPIKQFGTGINSLTTQGQTDHLTKQSIIQQSNIYFEQKSEEESIGKWKKNSKAIQKPITLKTQNNQNSNPNIKHEMTDDQKLTRCQIQKKTIENKLMKVERLKRYTPEDRVAMEQLEKQLYEVDSSISALKRKIRQKY